MQWKQKFEYKWEVGSIMKTTRDITFEGDHVVLPKGSIVKIYSRNQGYNCRVLQPAVFDGMWCASVRIIDRNHDILREIHSQEWITILNKETEDE